MITLNDLRIIQTKVNLLPYKSDAENFGTPEFWARISELGSGDCDDYELEKYHRLILIGMKPSQLRLATCFVEEHRDSEGQWVPKKDRYHLVLLVDLNGITYVLDNRYPHPMEWELLPYEWHKLQIPGTQAWEWAVNADRSFG